MTRLTTRFWFSVHSSSVWCLIFGFVVNVGLVGILELLLLLVAHLLDAVEFVGALGLLQFFLLLQLELSLVNVFVLNVTDHTIDDIGNGVKLLLLRGIFGEQEVRDLLAVDAFLKVLVDGQDLVVQIVSELRVYSGCIFKGGDLVEELLDQLTNFSPPKLGFLGI